MVIRQVRSCVWVFVAFYGFFWTTTAPAIRAQESMAVVQAKRFFDLLLNQQYDKAFSQLTPTMKKFLPPTRMKVMMASLEQQLGHFVGIDSLYTENLDTLVRVHLICQFEKEIVDVQVVLDSSSRVGGLWFHPLKKVSYELPSYVDTSRFNEQQLTFGRSAFRLTGTLTIPKGEGPFPAVVLIHGSGPNDRDETIGPNKPFRDLAWGLASNGIAVFRYDKRTFTYARKLAAKEITVEEEVIEDALLALQRIRKHPAVDSQQVYLLGHSLGGMLVPEIAHRDGKVVGMILLAAPARNLDAVLLDQLVYLRSLKRNPTEAAKIDSLIRLVEKLTKNELDSSAKVLGAHAGYYYDLRRHLPFSFLKKLHWRVLVLQGGRDYQVPDRDKKMWRSFCEKISGIEYQEYADLNHLFIPGKGKATPEEYTTVKGHVAPRVIRKIVAWIRSAQE